MVYRVCTTRTGLDGLFSALELSEFGQNMANSKGGISQRRQYVIRIDVLFWGGAGIYNRTSFERILVEHCMAL